MDITKTENKNISTHCQLAGFAEASSVPSIASENFLTVKGESAYIDMGLFYSYIVSNCIRWWPEPVEIDPTKTDAFLKPIFDSLKTQGVTQIDLSFSQIANIDALLSGAGAGGTDAVGQIFKDGYNVGDTGKNFLAYLTDTAHANGVKCDLSFGGENATSDDMKIQGDPTSQAEHLAEFMNRYNIDAVDWDIEGANAHALMTVNRPEDAALFFQKLHSLLSAQGKESVLTIEGNLQNASGDLSPLFQQFDQTFDGLNLMLYDGGTHYYLDADNPTWGLKQWLSYVKDPSKIHVGFFDAIPYENPSASAGGQYPVPQGLSRGAAAAWVYEYVLNQLGLSSDQAGAPFWWTQDPTRLPSDQTIVDFWNALQNKRIK